MCSKEFKVGLKYRQKKGGRGRERVKIKNQKTKGFTKKYDPPPRLKATVGRGLKIKNQ